MQVLVVDDERVIAETLVQILKQAGFEAQCLYDGAAAIDKAKNCPFDFLICDVVMDGVNGIEASIEIQKTLPNCKVLLISGNNATSELLAAAEIKGYTFDILAKPVHPTQIIGKLRSLSVSAN